MVAARVCVKSGGLSGWLVRRTAKGWCAHTCTQHNIEHVPSRLNILVDMCCITFFSASNNSRDVRVCFCFRWDDGRRRQTRRAWSNVKRCTIFILDFTINHANDIHRMTTPSSTGITLCAECTEKDWNERGTKKSFHYANKRNKYFEYVWSWFYFSFFVFLLFVVAALVFAQSTYRCCSLCVACMLMHGGYVCLYVLCTPIILFARKQNH